MDDSKRKDENIAGNGFVFRLVQAIIYLISMVVFSVLAAVYGVIGSGGQQYYEFLFCIFLGIAAFFMVYTILQFVVTFVGKYAIDANNFGIVINVILCCWFYGIFGIIGSVKGRSCLKYRLSMCSETLESEMPQIEQQVIEEQQVGEGKIAIE